MDLVNRIKEIAKKNEEKVRDVRRHLHMHPELSFKEFETSKFISNFLTKHNIEHTTGWVDTGILAIIKGAKPGPTRALRADIDALPITEANDVSYKSKNDGRMHACGHDVHTASLLGAILILDELKEEISGTIQCVFQPGEERYPGGAKLLLEEKVFGNELPEFIVGQHVHPPLEVGKVGVKPGQYMASADEIYITVKGKGGHAALPQDAIDPIVITSHLIIALQQIISRKKDPTSPSVLTIGKINSTGGSTNVIPGEVKLEGTFRAMSEEWRFEAHEHIKNVCNSIAQSMGGSCEVDIKVGYPSLFNDPTITQKLLLKMNEFMGEQKVDILPLRMTAEDFAYYSQKMPAMFYRLGTGNEARGIVNSVHHPNFDVDEDALIVGAGLMAFLVA